MGIMRYMGRWGTFIWERFPPLANGLFILILYGANTAASILAAGTSEPSIRAIAVGAVLFLLDYFRIRVFDEIKDYKTDLQVHPERPLARGLITLKEARITGFSIIGVEIALLFFLPTAAIPGFALAVGFSLLMYKEFFAPGLLSTNLLVYALSHTPLSGFLALFNFSIATGRLFWEAPLPIWLLVVSNIALAMVYDISRKCYGKGEEKDKQETYTRQFGIPLSAVLCLFFLLLTGAGAWIAGALLGLGTLYFVLMAVLTGLCMLAGILFAVIRDKKTGSLFRLTGLAFIVLFNVVVMAGVLWMR